jgi:hypothetical protein
VKNRLAAAGVVLGLVGGGAIGVALGSPGVSNAQTSPVTTAAATADARGVDDSNKDAVHEAAETPEQAAAEMAGKHGGHGHGGPGGDRHGGASNEDPTHEAAESPEREAQEDAEKAAAATAPATPATTNG